MKLKYSEQFYKYFNKRIKPHAKLRIQFYERLTLFQQNPRNPLLRDHKLSGKKTGFRAFSITGDIRVIYSIEGDIIYFIDIGSHNQVY